MQWWNAFASERKLEQAAVEGKAETRLAEGGDILNWNVEGYLFFKAGERFSWGPGYKYEQHREPGEAFTEEHRFRFAGKARLGVAAACKTSLRGLYEYRDREGRKRSWRFRLRPEVRRALGASGWDLAASDEVFYDSTQDRIAQNRLQLGFERPLSKKTSLLVYYMARSDRLAGKWEETQILGTVWRFH